MYHEFKGHNLSLYQLSQDEYVKVNHSIHVCLKSAISRILRTTAVAQVCDPDLFKNIDADKRTDCGNCVANLTLLIRGLARLIYFGTDFFGGNFMDLFKEVVTEEGICYTYNAIEYYRNANDDEHVSWTLEDGYVPNNVSLADSYPKKGSKHSLFVILQSEIWNFDFVCKGSLQSHKVYLHLPSESPQTSNNYYLVPLQQSVYLNIVPKMTLMASELRDYPVNKRQCYFNSERYLRFFKYYTQNNCEADCVANLTLSRCGCLRFHLPSKYSNS
jgi:acid-sensing ion channel, other